MNQEYQPEWLLPPEAEIAHWFRVKTQYYPGYDLIEKYQDAALKLKLDQDNLFCLFFGHQIIATFLFAIIMIIFARGGEPGFVMIKEIDIPSEFEVICSISICIFTPPRLSVHLYP